MEAVAILQFQQPILLQFYKQSVLKNTFGLGCFLTECRNSPSLSLPPSPIRPPRPPLVFHSPSRGNPPQRLNSSPKPYRRRRRRPVQLFSHAPYTASPSNVTLLDRHGNLYKGSYLESAAFNPNLSPVQAALVAFVAARGDDDYHDIVDAVLVEKEDVAVKQEQAASYKRDAVVAARCREHGKTVAAGNGGT
ncbi:cytidine deaminase [Vigna unguiculata]|uniref:Cytidine deaminase n=1 Tax=Vigna unguiculata TaxID=3917 RepID=A0A4D6KW94_VIGUN|nr:cytidine deaminase [Vigna unguiculata]